MTPRRNGTPSYCMRRLILRLKGIRPSYHDWPQEKQRTVRLATINFEPAVMRFHRQIPPVFAGDTVVRLLIPQAGERASSQHAAIMAEERTAFIMAA